MAQWEAEFTPLISSIRNEQAQQLEPAGDFLHLLYADGFAKPSCRKKETAMALDLEGGFCSPVKSSDK